LVLHSLVEIIALGHVLDCLSVNECETTIEDSSSVVLMLLAMLFVLISFSIFAQTGYLTIFHIFLATKGMTSYEFVTRNDERPEEKQIERDGTSNKY
jgi:hypothetical protein